MKQQNEAAAEIIRVLDAIGYNVDRLDIKTPGDPEESAYIEAEIRISRHHHP
jgi:hypothetical protein